MNLCNEENLPGRYRTSRDQYDLLPNIEVYTEAKLLQKKTTTRCLPYTLKSFINVTYSTSLDMRRVNMGKLRLGYSDIEDIDLQDDYEEDRYSPLIAAVSNTNSLKMKADSSASEYDGNEYCYPLTKRGEKSSDLSSRYEDAESDDTEEDDTDGLEETTSFSREGGISQPQVAKYFTYLAIFLPSLVAVFSPLIEIEPTARIEMSSLITDTLLITLVSWFIKLTIEWPWNWRQQLEETKLKALANVNNLFRRCKSNPGEQSKERFVQSVVLTKGLKKYEFYSLCTCFLSPFVGGIIMVLSRKHIMIEESRRDLVFSNLNILLYVFLGIFRLLLLFATRLQEKTKLYSSLKLKRRSEPKCSIFEQDLDNFLPDELKKKRSNANILMQIARSIFDLTWRSDINEKEKLNRTRIESLQEEAFHQRQLINGILTNQAGECSKIGQSLSRLESAVIQLKIQSENNHENENVPYLRPFPLNIHLESNSNKRFHNKYLQYSRRQGKPQMKTIFEEVESEAPVLSKATEDENQPMNQAQQKNQKKPIGKFPSLFENQNSSVSQASSYKDSIFEQPKALRNLDSSTLERQRSQKNLHRSENRNQRHFSLHGLPVNSLYEDNEFFGPIRSSLSIEGASDDSQINDTFESSDASNFIAIMRKIFLRFLLLDVLKDPKNLSLTLKNDIYPELVDAYDNKKQKYSEKILFCMQLVYDVASDYISYIIKNHKLIMTTHFQPIKRVKDFVVLVFIKLPVNIFRFYFEIIAFFPKIVFNIFVMNPIVELSKCILKEEESYAELYLQKFPLRELMPRSKKKPFRKAFKEYKPKDFIVEGYKGSNKYRYSSYNQPKATFTPVKMYSNDSAICNN